jgi:hypothetical protein
MELTQEGLKELLRRDEETGKFYWKVDSRGNGLGHKVGDVAGTIHNGYVVIHIGGIDYGAHCLTWLYVYGVCPKEKVDHDKKDRILYVHPSVDLTVINFYRANAHGRTNDV